MNPLGPVEGKFYANLCCSLNGSDIFIIVLKQRWQGLKEYNTSYKQTYKNHKKSWKK